MQSTKKNNGARKQKNVGKGSSSATTTGKMKTTTVEAPITRGAKNTTGHPRGLSSSEGFRVRHTELVTSVTAGASNGANLISLRIQPTDTSMFPWLSQIADRFEKYVVHSLSFEYSSVSPSTERGVIVLAIDYDPDDEGPTGLGNDTRMELLSHEGAYQGPIWTCATMSASQKQLATVKERFVRNWSGEPILFEPRTADVGRLFVGVFGCAPAAPNSDQSNRWIGDLRVSYDITLMLPQMHSRTVDASPQYIRLIPTRPTATLPDDGSAGLDPVVPLDTIGAETGLEVQVDTNGPQLLELVRDVYDDTTSQLINVLRVREPFEGTVTLELDAYLPESGGPAPENPHEYAAFEFVPTDPQARIEPGSHVQLTRKYTPPGTETLFPSSQASGRDSWDGAATWHGQFGTTNGGYDALTRKIVQVSGRFVENTAINFMAAGLNTIAYLACRVLASQRQGLPQVELQGRQKRIIYQYNPLRGRPMIPWVPYEKSEKELGRTTSLGSFLPESRPKPIGPGAVRR